MAGRARGSVFFLTDYGLADEFAGVVRAAVLRVAPGAPIIDLTHGVTPFDVRAGALALVRAAPHLGPGVVLAVIDPQVGTSRRALALSVARSTETEGPQYFVGPDNGLLLWAVDALGGVECAVALASPSGAPFGVPSASAATFDGRDLFAPVAARLWRGSSLKEVGEEIDPGSLVRLADPHVSTSPGALAAEVLWVDRFGNVQLAARLADADAAALGGELGSELEVIAGAVHRARRVRTFAALDSDTLGLVVDANGHLAVVCDRQSAATVLQVQPGDLVTVRALSGCESP